MWKKIWCLYQEQYNQVILGVINLIIVEPEILFQELGIEMTTERKTHEVD